MGRGFLQAVLRLIRQTNRAVIPAQTAASENQV